MKYYDVSLPVHDGMLSWPSDPDVKITQWKTIAEKGSNVVKLEAGNHFGTHLDAPKHNLEGGAGVEVFTPEQLIGPVVVCDLTSVEDEIQPDDLAKVVPGGATRVLMKTRNTTDQLLTKPFTENYVALSGDGAEWLAERGVRVVGIDYLSIQRRGSDGRAHTELEKRDIAIIEGLWLVDVPAGEYELIALPILIKDGDGAPARVLLRTQA